MDLNQSVIDVTLKQEKIDAKEKIDLNKTVVQESEQLPVIKSNFMQKRNSEISGIKLSKKHFSSFRTK